MIAIYTATEATWTPTPYLELPSGAGAALETERAPSSHPAPRLVEALKSEDYTSRANAVSALVFLAKEGGYTAILLH